MRIFTRSMPVKIFQSEDLIAMPKKSADKPAPEKSSVRKASKKSAEPAVKTDKKAAKADKPAASTSPKVKAAKKAPAKKSQKPEKSPKVKLSPEQLEEHIRIAAYYRWEQGGRNDGASEADWLDAENDIRQ